MIRDIQTPILPMMQALGAVLLEIDAAKRQYQSTEEVLRRYPHRYYTVMELRVDLIDQIKALEKTEIEMYERLELAEELLHNDIPITTTAHHIIFLS